MPDISIVDNLSEALGNSDDQTPDEIRKELREEGTDVESLEKRLLEHEEIIRNEHRKSQKTGLCEELRLFVKDVTLFLQKHSHYNPKKMEPMFQRAYHLYAKYDVETTSQCKIMVAKSEWERCESCEHLYSSVWRAPDEIWNKVTGITDGSGLYCVDCFSEIAEQKNIILYWECQMGEFSTIKNEKQKADIGTTSEKTRCIWWRECRLVNTSICKNRKCVDYTPGP